jgi:predicted metal-dependent phosphoesterase TrpH
MVQITSDPEIFRKKGLNFVDMHHHSTCSDGKHTPEFLAKVFAKKGFGLCLTDHNEIKGSLELAKNKKVFTIPSVEITSRELKDVLAYFYKPGDLKAFWEKEIKNNYKRTFGFNLHKTNISIFDLPEKIRDYNGVAVLAHPFVMIPKKSYRLAAKDEFLKKLDGVELTSSETKNSRRLNKILGLNKPLTAGTDSHLVSTFDHLTASYSQDVESFMDIILKRKNIIYTKSHYSFNKFKNSLVVLKNNLHLF